MIRAFPLDERRTLRILAANAATARLYGYSPSELERMTIIDLRPPEETRRALDHAL